MEILSTLAATIARIAEARHDLDALLDARDEQIRAALAAEASYAALCEATGLSRSALDAIRQGRRRR